MSNLSKKSLFGPFRGYIMIFKVQFFKNHVLRPIKMIKKWPFLKGAHLGGENDQNLGNFSNRKLSSADSYGSLASSYLPQTRTSSLLKSHQDELFSNRKSFAGTRTSRYVFIWIKVHSLFEFQINNLDKAELLPLKFI